MGGGGGEGRKGVEDTWCLRVLNIIVLHVYYQLLNTTSYTT